MKRMVLRIFIAFFVLIVILLSVVLIRTVRLKSRQLQVEPIADIEIKSNTAAEHLAEAVKFKTISFQDRSAIQEQEFLAFHQFLEEAFPHVHSKLQKEVIGDLSLLFTWEGQNQELKPILIIAHMDVVPVEPGTEEDWIHPPFQGNIADGYIWGRGAVDDKGSLIGILEAVEWLLERDYQPRRTVYLGFGHDEEVGGIKGALQIADHLDSRNVELEYVHDEGLVIISGAMPGISKPVAMVGIAMKGYLSLELLVESEGGHSSMPGKETSIGILSSALHRLGKRQIPTKIELPVQQMFNYVAPEMKFFMKMVFANQRLFGGMIKKNLATKPSSNALVRTIMAPTIFEGGEKENILPKKARAIVNFRTLPGTRNEDIIEHVQGSIKDPRVKIRAIQEFQTEPSSVSDVESPGFGVLHKTIQQIFPDVVVAPGLVLGAADSRHYAKLSENIYMIVPYRFIPEEVSMVHGTNERVSIKNYVEVIRFYVQLIRNST